MLTTMLTARAARAARMAWPSHRRVGAVLARNVGALRSGPYYWLVVVSGFFEPLLYLLSIGVGVGALVGGMPMGDGRTVDYAAYVAPAMVAVAAMSGALSETTYNFFFKMRYAKTLEAVLATPVRPMEVALGELLWAVTRGAFYTVMFLVVMVALGLCGPAAAAAALPGAVLVGVAFAAAGLAVSTLLRGWQDFDLIAVVQFTLFLFSGAFSPVADYPPVFATLVTLTPLYHGVELVRGLVLGGGGPLWGHAAYLAVMSAAGLWFAARRLGRRLLP
ncbi:ABC transporter permease [Spongiactinospora sp. TRM90649]|uniref:ABC transporter permease n=1 Tax=Spongiactinospora sp. TRM90649 TaxID=3031114 RepID=UPI0023F74689|nr:ABC transporter permease [Spongiactinospora sp. TRM90649]MDF5756693.1 ABC transporter permease [Spongiactinospora sp. TRM90649]